MIKRIKRVWERNKNRINNAVMDAATSSVAFYVRKRKIRYGLNTTQKREQKIIVSMATYNKRYDTIYYALKSLLLQSVRPDKIIVWLDMESEENHITKEMLDLEKYGIEYRYTTLELRSHKKYFWAMQEYPDDIIITVDDDAFYSPNMISSLMKSYRKYPNAVSARRVHLITTANNQISSYSKWKIEYKKLKKPSHFLCAIGCGGILYPPHLLTPEVFNHENIKQLCPNADDLWLKTMELLSDVKVVWKPCFIVRPRAIDGSQEVGLKLLNVYGNGENDLYIKNLRSAYPRAFIHLTQ